MQKESGRTYRLSDAESREAFRQEYEKLIHKEALHQCRNEETADLLTQYVLVKVEHDYKDRKLSDPCDTFLLGQVLQAYALYGFQPDKLSQEIDRLKDGGAKRRSFERRRQLPRMRPDAVDGQRSRVVHVSELAAKLTRKNQSDTAVVETENAEDEVIIETVEDEIRPGNGEESSSEQVERTPEFVAEESEDIPAQEEPAEPEPETAESYNLEIDVELPSVQKPDETEDSAEQAEESEAVQEEIIAEEAVVEDVPETVEETAEETVETESSAEPAEESEAVQEEIIAEETVELEDVPETVEEAAEETVEAEDSAEPAEESEAVQEETVAEETVELEDVPEIVEEAAEETIEAEDSAEPAEETEAVQEKTVAEETVELENAPETVEEAAEETIEAEDSAEPAEETEAVQEKTFVEETVELEEVPETAEEIALEVAEVQEADGPQEEREAAEEPEQSADGLAASLEMAQETMEAEKPLEIADKPVIFREQIIRDDAQAEPLDKIAREPGSGRVIIGQDAFVMETGTAVEKRRAEPAAYDERPQEESEAENRQVLEQVPEKKKNSSPPAEREKWLEPVIDEEEPKSGIDGRLILNIILGIGAAAAAFFMLHELGIIPDIFKLL